MGNFTGFLGLFVVVSSLSFAASYPSFDYCNGTSWIRFKGNCYSFESKSQGRVSYYDAEDYCRSQGAHLVSIHSDEENEFILRTLGQGRFGGRLWIGLNVLDGDNNPKWSDDTPVVYQKRVIKEYYKRERCFIMFLSQRGWRPEHCALHYTPLCKRPEGVQPTVIPPPTTPEPSTGNCPSGWIQLGQKCYKYFGNTEGDRLKYFDARNACWNLGNGSSLVSIHSMKEQAFLTQHLFDLGTSAWIGINKVESDEIGHDIVFGWVDNTRNDFSYWMKGHPPEGTWKYCGRLSFEGINKGEWMADYCEVEKRGYICQRPTVSNVPKPVPDPTKCKQGFQEYRNSCYRYMPEPRIQEKAEETCESLGGHLVSVVDGFEQAFLNYFLINASRPISIGLESVQGTKFLQWTDKEPLYFSNWEKEQPRQISSNKSCVSMDPSNGFKWNITDCNRSLPYVCKTTSDVSPKVPVVLGKCPTNEGSWIDIGDKYCYHVANDTYRVLSWDTTSRYCLSKGMSMVSLHSDHEVKSLVAYFWKETRNVHLGLYKSFDKESFMWADSSPLNYTNWADREPSTWSSNKDCAAFTPTDGKWVSINCAEGGLALCRSDKVVKN